MESVFISLGWVIVFVLLIIVSKLSTINDSINSLKNQLNRENGENPLDKIISEKLKQDNLKK